MTTGSLATSRPLGTLGALAILGVASFFAVVAVIHEPIGAGSGRLGVNAPSVLTIASGAPRSLTTADVDAISRNVPGITALSRMVLGTAQVAAGTQAGPLTVQGVDPLYAQVTAASIAPGVFFGLQDASAANPVAILGQTLADRLFAGASPVGQTIRIRSVPYTIIGVLAAQAHPPAQGADDAVLIPFQTGQVRLFGPSALDLVMVQVRDASQADAIRLQIQQLLRQRHQVRAGQPDGFSLGTTSPAASGDVTETTLQKMGHLLQQYRQYVCEAKGLCAKPE